MPFLLYFNTYNFRSIVIEYSFIFSACRLFNILWWLHYPDVSGKWSMELSDVMFRRTKHFLLLLGLCKHLANLFLCAIKHIYTKEQRTCDGISWLQFFLEKWGYLERRLKELPGYKSKAFPCDKGRVNTLPTTSFVLSGIMVQLLLEKQGYLAKRRKNHHLRDAERWYIQVLRWQRWFDCSIDSDTCHSEKCREWNINFLADPMFWGGYGIGLQVIVLEGFLEKSISSFCSVFKVYWNWLACSISSNHFNHKPVVRHLICSILMHV